MQVLHIIANRDNSGGTIAAINLHKALISAGYKSTVLASDKFYGELEGKGYRRYGGVTGRIQQAFLKLEDYLARPGFINPTDKWVLKKDLKNFEGVVHIHVTHVTQISFGLLNWLSTNNKVFWTLHDLWPLTAKCIHPTYCEKWLHNCYDCPKLTEYPTLRWDNTPLLHRKKQDFIGKHKIHFIAPSQWINSLTDMYIRQLGGQISIIPHGIDNSIFKPADKQTVRAEFNLPQKGQFILFPQGRWDDPKKGAEWYTEIKKALQLSQNNEPHHYLIKVDGTSITQTKLTTGLTEITLPRTTDKAIMAKYYQLADLSVSLSEVETFGLCVAESLACHTPVIGRRAKGVEELLGYHDEIMASQITELVTLILEEKWKDFDFRAIFDNEHSTQAWANQHIKLYES